MSVDDAERTECCLTTDLQLIFMETTAQSMNSEKEIRSGAGEPPNTKCVSPWVRLTGHGEGRLCAGCPSVPALPFPARDGSVLGAVSPGSVAAALVAAWAAGALGRTGSECLAPRGGSECGGS